MKNRKDNNTSGKADKLLKRMKWAKEELYRSFPKEESDRIWKAVHDRLEGYLEEYADIPEGERIHTDSRIFPIPEMAEGEHSHIGVLLFSAGFTVMMALDVALG